MEWEREEDKVEDAEQRQMMGKQTRTAQVENQKPENGIMLIIACTALRTSDMKTMNIYKSSKTECKCKQILLARNVKLWRCL